MRARAKRMGRPVKAAPKSGTVWLSHRVPAKLKGMLEAAAVKNGTTLSAEAARRLEQTFKLPETMKSLAIPLHAVALTEEARKTTWWDDLDTCQDVLGLITAFFRRFGPPEIKNTWPPGDALWATVSQQYDRWLDQIIQSFTVTPSKRPKGEQP